MTLNKAQRKAASYLLGDKLIARPCMNEGEGVTADGKPAIYLPNDKRWKIFHELTAKLSWEDATADDWFIRSVIL